MKFVANDGKVFDNQKECALYEKELANCYWRIVVKKDKARNQSDKRFINVVYPYAGSDEELTKLYLEDWCNRHFGSVLIDINGSPSRKYCVYNSTKQGFDEQGKDITHYVARGFFDDQTDTERINLDIIDEKEVNK